MSETVWSYNESGRTSELWELASMRCPCCGVSTFARFVGLDELLTVVAQDERGRLLITCPRHSLADVHAMLHGKDRR